MKTVKELTGNNNQSKEPSCIKGKIFLDENGDVMTIYVQGILVDFEITRPADKYTTEESDDFLIDAGWEKVTNKDNDLTDWIMTDRLSSLKWDGEERNYFDF